MSSTSQQKPATSTVPPSTFPVDLDKVSLQQALRDFEMANARVLDLTQRLIASERSRKALESELNQLKLQHNAEAQPSGLLNVATSVLSSIATRLGR